MAVVRLWRELKRKAAQGRIYAALKHVSLSVMANCLKRCGKFKRGGAVSRAVA
ncbi:hypothetical protein V6N98_000249 [Campylobacter upsaliensis]